MPETNDLPSAEKKSCFVVMGFGIKTDFATGRKLDLNKSYRLLIKPTVEAKGLACIRADEILTSGSIETPMYRELLKADVVVADLSTANLNAFYELGVRHALRPRTTIVISEDKLPYPFDLNHIKITSYTHLGDAIDYEEVERFRKLLGETIDDVLNDQEPDSPVYTFLQLIPPSLKQQVTETAEKVKTALKETGSSDGSDKAEESSFTETLSLLTEQAEQALRIKNFEKARTFFNSALLILNSSAEKKTITNNAYLIQRLALTTYKAKQPDEVSALANAMALLAQLDLNHTNDPETVSLAGAVEKRLFEIGQGDEHLTNAILYFERGYYLLNNRYNAINLAYLLNCRVGTSIFKTREDQVADMVWASRTRRRVLELCENDWNKIVRTDRSPGEATNEASKELSENQKASENETRFWILANEAEAHFGLGDIKEYQTARLGAMNYEYEPWMIESLDQQVIKLGLIMKKYGSLLNPPWVEGDPVNP